MPSLRSKVRLAPLPSGSIPARSLILCLVERYAAPMKSNHPLEGRRVRLALLLWLAGMIGAVVITVAVIPQLAEQHALPMPVSVLTVASLCQSALLIGLAVWAGTALSPAVGLHAAIFEAAVTSRPLSPAFRAQVWPGLLAGALGGALLLAFSHYTPAAIAAVQDRFNPSLLARVLYGGVTEELLLRWGVMTTLLWLIWRFVHRRRGRSWRGFRLARYRDQCAAVWVGAPACRGSADRKLVGRCRIFCRRCQRNVWRAVRLLVLAFRVGGRDDCSRHRARS